MRFAPILLLALTACEEHHEAENVEAILCVRTAGDELEVELLHSCVSSSQYDREFTCDAVRSGASLEVSSLFTYTTKGNSTTLDCGTITTTCAVPLPEDGVYTLIYGDQTMSFTVAEGAVEVPAGEDAVCSGMARRR